MAERKVKAELKVEELPAEVQELGAEEAEGTQGGILIGLLLPAVQKVREAASVKIEQKVSPGITDGTSNTFMG